MASPAPTLVGWGMAPMTSPPRYGFGRRSVALVVLAASVGMVLSALPSVRLLLDPPDPWFCPAIWPSATSCVPGQHLVVVGVAAIVLASAWVVADVVLRRVIDVPTRIAIVAALTVVAMAAWSSAHTPQPLFVAWSGLIG